MNPVIAAAAVKAGKDTLGYASKVGQAVIDSPENQEELERKLKLPKGSIQKMADGEEDPKLSTVIGIVIRTNWFKTIPLDVSIVCLVCYIICAVVTAANWDRFIDWLKNEGKHSITIKY